jgi:hypothetical protein
MLKSILCSVHSMQRVKRLTRNYESSARPFMLTGVSSAKDGVISQLLAIILDSLLCSAN